MAPKSRFGEGEKVLCFHGPLLYEAKCLKFQVKEKNMKYFIHYSGWNKNWDEWVPETRIMKYNDANIQKQKDLTSTYMKSKKNKTLKTGAKKEPEKETKEKERESTPTVQAAPEKIEKPPKVKAEKKPVKCEVVEIEDEEDIIELPAPKKIKRELDVIKQELEFVEEPKPEVKIKVKLPHPLENWLVDDWDIIVRQKKLLNLPARITIDHIVASYIKEKVSVKGLSSDAEANIVSVANRARECFNVLLGKFLLYKFERPQYAEMLANHPNLKMCQIYGAVHFIRMFTKLGEFFSQTVSTVPASCTNITTLVEEHLNDFARYIASNPSFFSLKEYIVASPEYHRRALS